MTELDFDRSEPPVMPSRERRQPTTDDERRVQRLQERAGEVIVASLSKKEMTILERQLDKRDFYGR